MGIAAILITWPRCGKQTFVAPAQEGSIWNFALIGPVVSEKSVDDRQTDGLNNLDRGPQEELHTKYQRPRPFSFKQKDF